MPKMEQIISREGSRAMEEWLLSILRFAITLDEIDRVAVFAAAAAMGRRDSGFTFFARTSVKVCDAIVAKDRAEAISALRVFVHAIDHVALRRAFEAVLEIKPPGADRHTIASRNRENLWHGLPTRKAGTASWR